MLSWFQLPSGSAVKYVLQPQAGEYSNWRIRRNKASVLELLHSDLINTARLVATTTSALNAACRDNERLLSQLQAYLPGRSTAHHMIADRLLAIADGVELLDKIQSYQTRVDFACRLAETLLANRARSGAVDRAELQHVSDAWRGVCGHAICCIYDVESHLIAISSFPNDMDREVLELLQAARGGTAPSVEAGRLVVLEWGERRRHKRFDVDVVAIARSSEGEARVRIIDISVGGVCIQGMPPMAEGAAISLRLQDERSMSGKIRWQTAGRTGVRFDNDLLPDDPLLSASV